MLLKSLLLACLIALVACQTDSDCGSTYFNFYNGFNISGSYTETLWDWEGTDFSDGTSDTFDSYLYLDLIINNVTYPISDFYNSPVDYFCDIGTTNVTSAALATYTYNITDTIQILREFYAPRATTWLRVVDTVRNFGTEAATVSMTYYGNYGSDGSTTFSLLNDYYWVSSDGANGQDDPPFSVNAAGAGGQIIPTKLDGDFINGNDDTSYTYENVAIPVGEARSIMIVLGQHGDLDTANAGAVHINNQPDEIYANLNVSLENVVNWAMCGVQFQVVNPQTTYCETPMAITFTALFNGAVTVNDSPATSNGNGQFTANVVNGTTKVGYHRQVSDCAARTANFDFKLPSANLAITFDNSGQLPSVSTTGGYGTYEYSWKFSSGGDLTKVFGAQATVTVMDKEGCTKSADVTVPQLQLVTAPTAAGKISSASSVIGSLLCLAALAFVL